MMDERWNEYLEALRAIARAPAAADARRARAAEAATRTRESADGLVRSATARTGRLADRLRETGSRIDAALAEFRLTPAPPLEASPITIDDAHRRLDDLDHRLDLAVPALRAARAAARRRRVRRIVAATVLAVIILAVATAVAIT